MGVAKYYQADGPTGAGSGQPPQSDATLIDVSAVAELNVTPHQDAHDGALIAGAAVPIAALITALDAAAAADAAARAVAAAVAYHLRRVASTQVRSVGSWAGNLALAAVGKWPSDVLTAFATAGATLTVAPRPTGGGGGGGLTTISVAEYAAGGAAGATIVSVRLPLRRAASSSVVCHIDKTSQRHANSHAIVNAGFVLELAPDSTVAACAGAAGGVIAAGLYVPSASVAATVVGKRVDDEGAMRAFVSALLADATARGLAHDARNSDQYRLGLLASFAYKLFLRAQPTLPPPLASAVAGSLAAAADRPISEATQSVAVGDPKVAPVGTPMPKLTSRLQASGEAQYASDGVRAANELCGAFVMTTVASGVLSAIDFSATRAAPGVVAVITLADFPSREMPHSTETTPAYLLTVGDAVPCVGAHVALVVADSLAHARHAAKLAKLSYTAVARADAAAAAPRAVGAARFAELSAGRRADETAKRMMLPLSALAAATEAAEAEGAAGWTVLQGRRPPEWAAAAAAEGKRVLSGRFNIGGQKHFYMETHACVATPAEDGKLVLVCGTQSPQKTQQSVAAALGVGQHKVDVRVRRVGGAFGGKLSQQLPTAVVAAVAATKLRVPIRLHHERCDDMAAIGGRAPLEASWSAAFDDQSGVVSSVHLELSYDSGCTDGAGADGDLGMAVWWADNCYRHEDWSCGGGIVHSHRAGNTACRAPGVIQSVPLHEYVLEQVADAARLPPDAVREANLYKSGDVTPFGDRIGIDYNWTVPSMWAKAKGDWDVDGRRAAIATFNTANRWRKRGLSLLPVKYGITLSGYKMASTVRIFADGSVHVVHGGAEVGQGIHTKVAQAVAFALGCPLASVAVGDTSAIDAPNSDETGGSGTSEACVISVLGACATLGGRLAPYRGQGRVGGGGRRRERRPREFAGGGLVERADGEGARQLRLLHAGDRLRRGRGRRAHGRARAAARGSADGPGGAAQPGRRPRPGRGRLHDGAGPLPDRGAAVGRRRHPAQHRQLGVQDPRRPRHPARPQRGLPPQGAQPVGGGGAPLEGVRRAADGPRRRRLLRRVRRDPIGAARRRRRRPARGRRAAHGRARARGVRGGGGAVWAAVRAEWVSAQCCVSHHT